MLSFNQTKGALFSLSINFKSQRVPFVISVKSTVGFSELLTEIKHPLLMLYLFNVNCDDVKLDIRSNTVSDGTIVSNKYFLHLIAHFPLFLSSYFKSDLDYLVNSV